MTQFVSPFYEAQGFNCPFCNFFAHQRWLYLHYANTGTPIRNARVSTCAACGKDAFWFDGKIIYPFVGVGPHAAADMPPEIKADYDEANQISSLSPRGAAALLRLVIQKLCVEFGESGENINADISSLVAKGLPVGVQQAMDSVRVIGNNAVHAGQMDVSDDAATVRTLFALVNLIVSKMITEPKEIQRVFDSLPESAKAAIEKRDNRAKP